MSSQARLGYGAKIKMGDGGSPETFAEIGEVGDFEDGDTVGLIQVTNHQSPGGRHEHIADLIDGDEISFPVNYIPSDATHNRATGLRGKLRQRVNFQIEAPGETEGVQFQAIVIGVTRSMPVAGVMQMTVTLKKTGEPTFYSVA